MRALTRRQLLGRAAVAAGIPVLPVPSPLTHDEVEAMARAGEIPPVVAPDALAEAVRRRARELA